MTALCCPRCQFPIPGRLVTTTRGGLALRAPLQPDTILCCTQPGCTTAFRLTNGVPAEVTEEDIARLSPQQRLILVRFLRGDFRPEGLS